jgi:hypothetical protein
VFSVNGDLLHGASVSELASFYAYTTAHRGGVTVAAGDVNGDGRADIITGAGPGGSPHVRVFSGRDLSELASFYAYHPAFTGGVFVAASPRHSRVGSSSPRAPAPPRSGS